MTTMRKISGITLAAAAAALLMAGTVSSTPASADGSVKCAGINSCKGASACKTADNPGGPGQNSCKGHGLSMTNTADECTAAGGKIIQG